MIFKRYLDQNLNNSFPKYDIKIYLTEDKRHTPFIVKGLLYLEKIGFIILRFKSMPMLFKNRVELIDGEFKRGKKKTMIHRLEKAFGFLRRPLKS